MHAPSGGVPVRFFAPFDASAYADRRSRSVPEPGLYARPLTRAQRSVLLTPPAAPLDALRNETADLRDAAETFHRVPG